jgi:hypothetical protein
MDVDQHLAAFVDAFVSPGRRERLKYVFAHRGKNARSEGTALLSHLDERFCKRVDGAFGLDLSTEGVFYNFRQEPRPATLKDAIAAAGGDDVLFSIIAGKLAVYLSHEDMSWLCRR